MLFSDRRALVGLRCLPFCRKGKLLRAATTRADRQVRGKAVALQWDLWFLGMAMSPTSWNGPRIARIGVHPFFCFAFFLRDFYLKKVISAPHCPKGLVWKILSNGLHCVKVSFFFNIKCIRCDIRHMTTCNLKKKVTGRKRRKKNKKWRRKRGSFPLMLEFESLYYLEF